MRPEYSVILNFILYTEIKYKRLTQNLIRVVKLVVFGGFNGRVLLLVGYEHIAMNSVFYSI